jgi:hypothetical protein
MRSPAANLPDHAVLFRAWSQKDAPMAWVGLPPDLPKPGRPCERGSEVGDQGGIGKSALVAYNGVSRHYKI